MQNLAHMCTQDTHRDRLIPQLLLLKERRRWRNRLRVVVTLLQYLEYTLYALRTHHLFTSFLEVLVFNHFTIQYKSSSENPFY